MHFLTVRSCALSQVKEAEVTMDCFPMTAGLSQEHYRATINRRAQEAILGKQISILEFRANPQLHIPYVPTRTATTGLQVESNLGYHVDLNGMEFPAHSEM